MTRKALPQEAREVAERVGFEWVLAEDVEPGNLLGFRIRMEDPFFLPVTGVDLPDSTEDAGVIYVDLFDRTGRHEIQPTHAWRGQRVPLRRRVDCDWCPATAGSLTEQPTKEVPEMASERDPQDMDLDELTDELHRDADMADMCERLAGQLLCAFVFLWIKRGVRRRGGPKWAAYGFGAVAMYAAQPEIRKAVAEARPEVEEAIRQLREMRKESGTS